MYVGVGMGVSVAVGVYIGVGMSVGVSVGVYVGVGMGVGALHIPSVRTACRTWDTRVSLFYPASPGDSSCAAAT